MCELRRRFRDTRGSGARYRLRRPRDLLPPRLENLSTDAAGNLVPALRRLHSGHANDLSRAANIIASRRLTRDIVALPIGVLVAAVGQE